MNGVLVVDKSSGPTSFDVVRRVRRALRAQRVGHGGTLDPLATGVLPVCLGAATKLAPFLLGADKEYEAVLRFGAETDTADADGRVMVERPLGDLDEAALRALLPRFTGPQRQTPPMYSALKRAGRPLYEYARAGQEVERAPRDIVIHRLVLVAFTPPDRAVLRVRCSKGTYVRVLALDMGRAAGPGAHLAALRRTRSGPFTSEQAVTLDEVERGARVGDASPPLVSLADALAHLPAAAADDAVARDLAHGKRVPWRALSGAGGAPSDDEGAAPQPVRVLRADGSLLAVAEPRADGTVRTLRVFGPGPEPGPG